MPPGLVRDNVADALYENQRLKSLMTKCLLKERTIIISRYAPKETRSLNIGSKLILEFQWKILKDIYLDSDTIEMYEKIAEIIKNKVDELKYHLTYK